MKSTTLSVTIDASPMAVFDYVSNPAYLPNWAVNFAQSIRQDGDRWVVTTSNGEMETSIVCNAQHGVVDFHMRPAPNVLSVAPSRVVANGDGSEYIFTMFQGPDMPDEELKALGSALREELDLLKKLMEEKQ